MHLFTDLSRMTPEHATVLFFINFFGAYLISKYGRPAPKTRPERVRA